MHYGLALSSYLWGISVITPLPLGEEFGGGVWGRGQLVGQALLPFLSFLYRVPTIIL